MIVPTTTKVVRNDAKVSTPSCVHRFHIEPLRILGRGNSATTNLKNCAGSSYAMRISSSSSSGFWVTLPLFAASSNRASQPLVYSIHCRGRPGRVGDVRVLQLQKSYESKNVDLRVTRGDPHAITDDASQSISVNSNSIGCLENRIPILGR